MKIKLESWAPIGADGSTEARWIGVCLGIGTLAAIMNFFNNYHDALSRLYVGYYSSSMLFTGKLKPYDGAVIQPFPELIVGCESVLGLVCLLMPLLAAVHYAGHWYGSKSIYLMRRLPDRWELHRRCLAIPAAGMAAALAVLGLLCIVFYCVYRFCTPAQCLPV